MTTRLGTITGSETAPGPPLALELSDDGRQFLLGGVPIVDRIVAGLLATDRLVFDSADAADTAMRRLNDGPSNASG